MTSRGEGEGPGAFEKAEVFPGLPPLSERDRLLRLWVKPSFSAWTSWSIYRSGTTRWIRRITLRADRSWGADGVAAGTEIDPLIRALQTVTVPPFAQVDAGTDGTAYGLERECARLEWWERPRVWEPLAAWHDRARAALDRFLPEHRPGRG